MKNIFAPNSAAPKESGVFGLPYSAEESKLILLPVPWEPTTSYGGGTSRGPEAVLSASKQVDLFDIEVGKAYEAGIFMDSINMEIMGLSEEMRSFAHEIIERGGEIADRPELQEALVKINSA